MSRAPKRNPNALPEILIRTESDDDDCDDDDDDYYGHGTFPLVERDSPFTPAVQRLPDGRTVRNRVRPVLVISEECGGVPNRKSDLCCWWDFHPFETDRFFVPHRFDQRKETFFVHGNFCSPSCAKAHIVDRGRVDNVVKIIAWFSLMCKRVYGINVGTPVRSAPPRQMLSVFGGPFDIEEFRGTNVASRFRIVHPPLFLVVQEVHEMIHDEKQRQEDQKQKHLAASKRVAEDDSIVASQAAKRKRTVPIPILRQHQPLKLLRGMELPGSKSALSNFMNITTHKRK